jgi:hypothetical protein
MSQKPHPKDDEPPLYVGLRFEEDANLPPHTVSVRSGAQGVDIINVGGVTAFPAISGPITYDVAFMDGLIIPLDAEEAPAAQSED